MSTGSVRTMIIYHEEVEVKVKLELKEVKLVITIWLTLITQGSQLPACMEVEVVELFIVIF